ncbi:MAG: hypothetical protein FJ221_07825 [Lentisphaerae bacterium]|nr:hypothetical protein [Lentisphaerota bacterium]
MNESSRLQAGKACFIDVRAMSGRRARRVAWLLVALCAAHAAAGKDAEVIASFEKPDSARNWVSVNDGVMGGVSKGGFERTERKTLRFSGALSLENNGGFASIRTKPSALDLAGASGILVKARGDGRTYWVGLHTAGQFDASSFRAYLPTSKGEFTETLLPLSDFKLQAFGRTLPSGPVDPASITSVGFTIADKKAGPFELEIEYVKAVFQDAKPASRDPGGTIVDVATQAGTFKTLVAAAVAAGLAGPLSGEGPFTVFAPTDEAFSRLPAGTVDNLLKPENKQRLAGILQYHVIAGRITLAKALEAGEFVTLQGGALAAAFSGGRVRIGPAALIQADIPASNGIIHVVDQVLLPPEESVRPLTPVELIGLAIERGVPLFNNGNAGACAAVYEVTCEAVRTMPGVSEDSRKDLAQALVKMRAAKTELEKAWILRYALDRVASQGLEGK